MVSLQISESAVGALAGGSYILMSEDEETGRPVMRR